jgi:hypothetical protein
MNLQENINRIKEVMNIITEQESTEDEGNNFVITNATTIEEFTDYLDKRIEDNYYYGHADTLGYIIKDLVQNSFMASGKSEQESESMTKDFIADTVSSEFWSIPDQYDPYERRVEGNTKYRGIIIFEFSSGGDGYDYSGSFNDLTELFDDIKKLIQSGSIYEE